MNIDIRQRIINGLQGLRRRMYATRKYHNRSKYQPHQGEREKARRVRQMERQS